MKVSRAFVPVVKVEITFPCSEAEFMKVRQLFSKVSSLDKVESALSEYGIYPDNTAQKQPNVKVSRTIERTTQKEEQVLKDLRAKESQTPVLDAMTAAGLGRINISETVREYVRENPGMSRPEIADFLAEKHKGRVARFQFYNSIGTQIQHNKLAVSIVNGKRQIYTAAQA